MSAPLIRQQRGRKARRACHAPCRSPRCVVRAVVRQRAALREGAARYNGRRIWKRRRTAPN